MTESVPALVGPEVGTTHVGSPRKMAPIYAVNVIGGAKTTKVKAICTAMGQTKG
jgi:hypothetical protein